MLAVATPTVCVRPAEPDDLPALMRMAQDFHAASPCAPYIQFCPASMADTFHRLAVNDEACLLVGEVGGEVLGMIAGVATPHYVNAVHTTTQELFWWVDPAARHTRVGLRLLQAFEDWARAVGSRTLFMASTATLTPDKLARFYRRKGYGAVDVNYAKNLEN
jgi:GNAT superfamily N-acetyltransferase